MATLYKNCLVAKRKKQSKKVQKHCKAVTYKPMSGAKKYYLLQRIVIVPWGRTKTAEN
jgi:hypothetical protein